MPRQIFEFDPPERFVAGAVGPPGHRAFFLQARSGDRLTSVVLEKAQVAVLAERINELLDEVARRAGGSAPIPETAPTEGDDAPLDTPIEEEFRVGTMSLAWDPDAARLVVECYELVDSEPEALQDLPEALASGTRALMRVSLSGAAARTFARRALAVVAAGRPPCPLCGNPLDPEGHVCPRANGHHR